MQDSKNIITALKKAQSHLGNVIKMVEEKEYCVDILQQSSAVKQALSGIEDLILENHISTHVIEQFKAGKESKSIKEILVIYKLLKKK